jgi:hypothetical protein
MSIPKIGGNYLKIKFVINKQGTMFRAMAQKAASLKLG